MFGRLGKYDKLRRKPNLREGNVAEGKGFEPPEGVSSFNDLANRRLQPLGHPSAGATR